MVPISRKHEKITKLVAPILGYLTARYCKMYHSPRRNERRVNVDRLVMETSPAAERGARRVRDGPVSVKNPLVVVVLEPSRHLGERDESRASGFSGSACFVHHSSPVGDLVGRLAVRHSAMGSRCHGLPRLPVMCDGGVKARI